MAWFDTTFYVNFGDGSTTGYYAVAKRPQNTAVVAGQLVRQFTTPTVGNERVFVCVVAGTTANVTDATWIITRGGRTTDGTAAWCECTGAAGLNGDLTNTPVWARSLTVSPGAVFKRTNGASYQINGSGSNITTNASTEPAFSDTAGTTVAEGWTSLGPVGNFTGGMAPHARLNNALATNWFASGNTVYVGSNHAESQNTNIICGATSTLMARILCHDYAGSYPPTVLTTGATITATGGVSNRWIMQGSFYIYGITFISTGGAASVLSLNAATGVGNVQNWHYYDNCSFKNMNTHTNAWIQLGPDAATGSWAVTIFNNCTMGFGHVGQTLSPIQCDFTWKNTGRILTLDSVIPTDFWGMFAAPNTVVLEGLDLSQLTGTFFNPFTSSSLGTITIKDCKLNAAATNIAPINTGQTIQFSHSDSAATAYKSSRITYEGTESTETSIVRTGGYADPTGQVQSRKIVTSANVQWLRPYKAQPLSVWNSTVGSSKTVTVYGTVNAGALPNNDDIWMEVSYLGDAGSPASASVFGVSTAVTLSGGNLVATNTGTTSADQGARLADVFGLSGGKYYFEMTFTTIPSSTSVDVNIGCGVGTTASTFTNMGNSATAGVVLYKSTSIYANGSAVLLSGWAGSTGLVSGNTVGVAVDLDNRRIWFRIPLNGRWNDSGTADPATNTGGFTIPAGTIVPFVTFGGTGGTAGRVLTANFGASSFTYSVPSGFTSGWAIASSPKGSTATSGKAQVWSANAAVPSDGSSWNNTAFARWNPFDLQNMTLSNNGLTATATSATLSGVRAVEGRTSGKYYFEYTMSTWATASTSCGMALSTWNLSGVSTTGTVIVQKGGLLSTSGSGTGKTLGARAAGDIIGVAVDLGAQLIWFRVAPSGNWNGDVAANPATGANGFSFSTLVGALFPIFQPTAIADAATANFGDSTFSGAVPSGFTSGWTAVWSPFKLSTTFTPQLPGYVIPVIKAAKASTTYYIDPAVVVT